jgi:hypothetical protein
MPRILPALRVAATLTALVATLPALAGAQPAVAGARPAPGRWVAVVTNGFKGDSIHFVVGADGGSLRDLVFAGYWRCADGSMSGSLEETRVGPPDPIAVQNGAIASTQTRPSWWWQVAGRFTSATSAEGTYRQAAKSATCDTRVLRWTARRVAG